MSLRVKAETIQLSPYGKLHQLEGGGLAVRMDEVPWVKRIGFQQHILYEKQQELLLMVWFCSCVPVKEVCCIHPS